MRFFLRAVVFLVVWVTISAFALAQSVPTTAIVANAPVYSNGATMTQGNAGTNTPASRILGGPGCNTVGNTDGLSCWLWQALSGGTTSASTDPVATWTCPSPAATAGIYATSFPGASTETDNGVTFACLTAIDNMTLSQAFNDTTVSWAPVTAYYNGQYVKNQGVIYRNDMALTTTPFQCTSGATMPAPPGWSGAVSDGGCTDWVEQTPDIYSSLANVWQHQLYINGTGAASTAQFSAPFTVQVWHGGHSRLAYTPGLNNENATILMWRHFDYLNDVPPTCTGTCTWTLTVAPGDSFVDNVSPSTGPLSSTPGGNYGVYFEGVAQWPVGGPQSAYQTGGEPIAWSDTAGTTERAQIQSLYGQVANPSHEGGPGDEHTDNLTFYQDILDSGGGYGTAKCDGGCVFNSDLIIDRSLLPGSFALLSSYNISAYDSTLIGVNAANSVGAASESFFSGASSYFYNNDIFGFPNPYACGVSTTCTIGGSGHNGTDVASGTPPGGNFFPAYDLYGGSDTELAPGVQMRRATTINGMGSMRTSWFSRSCSRRSRPRSGPKGRATSMPSRRCRIISTRWG